MVGEPENNYSQADCCSFCDRKRKRVDPDCDYLFSIIMFAAEADHMVYFRNNPSLRVITDAKYLFDLDIEYALAYWLKTDIRITHFAFLNPYNCYVVTWTHSLPPPRESYKHTVQNKKDVESCILIEKLVKRTQFGRDIKSMFVL